MGRNEISPKLTPGMNDIRIIENSWIARIAANKLNSSTAAIVLGNTIYLYHTSKKDFLQDEKWLKHELCHVDQFRQYGYVNFIFRYLYESIKKGYYKNKFEEAARRAENL